MRIAAGFALIIAAVLISISYAVFVITDSRRLK